MGDLSFKQTTQNTLGPQKVFPRQMWSRDSGGSLDMAILPADLAEGYSAPVSD